MREPNFMCIGSAKSGTTSLYDILKQHPDIFLPSFKEPHFFDILDVYNKGLEWYKSTYFNNIEGQKCIGDFTPTYLFEKEAPKRILNDLGKDIKFIIILRNPVDRAYSHYLHSKRDLHENFSFFDAIELEDTSTNKIDYLSYLRKSYINQGLYFKMISNWFKYFPKENFLIINFEDEFILDRLKVISRILTFLEVSDCNIDVYKNSNKASKPKFIWLKELMKKSGWWRVLIKKMIPSLKKRQIIKNRIQRANISTFKPKKLSYIERKRIFNNYFKDDVLKLEKLLGRKMNWLE